jgi:methyl-accepting chemotaxis protein
LINFKEQLAAAISSLLDSKYEDIILQEFKVDDSLDLVKDRELIVTFMNEFQGFVKAAKRNAVLVHTLIPQVFGILSGLSSFDVTLGIESDNIVDYVKELNELSKDMRFKFAEISSEQSNTSVSVKKSGELLKAGVDEINEINLTVTEGSRLIERIDAALKDLTVKSADMSGEVDSLIGITKQIAATIIGIKTIADQTKLLALNAAVEAARAGAAGSGFAIIASEIRSLSDNTKKLLDRLNEMVEKVNTSSDNSKEGISATFKSIRDINEISEKLRANMEGSAKNAQNIAKNMSAVSSFSDEVSVRAAKTTEAINNSADNVEEIYGVTKSLTFVGDKLKQVGSSFTDVMNVAGKDTKRTAGDLMMTRQFGISNDEFIALLQNAITAHQNWVRTAAKIVDNMVVEPIQTDERNCVFGQYYFSILPKNTTVNKLWKEIDGIHHDLHVQGKYILAEVRTGNKKGAQRYLDVAESRSKDIIFKIQEIIDYVKKMKLSVFAKS